MPSRWVATGACPLLRAAALGGRPAVGVSPSAMGVAFLALLMVSGVAEVLRCAGPPPLGCDPARLVAVVALAPGDVCRGSPSQPGRTQATSLGDRPGGGLVGWAGLTRCSLPWALSSLSVVGPPYPKSTACGRARGLWRTAPGWGLCAGLVYGGSLVWGGVVLVLGVVYPARLCPSPKKKTVVLS